ncbi:4a-hydroxytetrahydrobiopterin dehydratase [Streptomyces sp. H27-D2]|uniref:4a-hydroxytetrahydrobiopterin dehydratase n=1 Tax=Streptomyces sp. H27-D2 TaxID=3046304 RepID=UPI002DBF7BDE|nr:4a-hydroxytetrahydrobiopterin dehydratase [Streptomyces sp. H27-D2]MEC4018731.1 4a-hydroxytetrahydrobiopterin dehydratase [Streptomyces sp. H27-D2]
MAPEPLSQKEIEDRLAELPGWAVRDEERITRTYTFDKHLPAAVMLLHIAQIQDELGHHADLSLSYDQLTVSVNTHSVGNAVTDLDFELARRVEAIAPGHGARTAGADR